MGLLSALKRGCWWVLVAVAVSVVLELVVSAALERMPSHERRAGCAECANAMHRFDSALKELVTEEAHRVARNSVEQTATAFVSAALATFQTAKRKELARQAVAAACRAPDSGKDCQPAILRHKSAAVKTSSNTDAVFHHAVRAAALARFTDPASHAEVASNTVLVPAATQVKATSAAVCVSACTRPSIVEALLPSALLADPALKPLLAVLSDMWGTVLIVGVMGTLLVMTLHVRASAAKQQHQLYQRLLQQFHGRVTTAHPTAGRRHGGGGSAAGRASSPAAGNP